MLRVENILPAPFYVKQSPCDSVNKVIWNIVSLILFPIGIFRFALYLLNKHLISKILLPSSIEWIKKARPLPDINEIEETLNKGRTIITKLTIKSAEGIDLDGVSVVSHKQEVLPKNEQNWVIYASGNSGSWQITMEHFINLSHTCGVNVICINYRGTRDSSRIQPLSQKDLLSDLEQCVLTLNKEGVPLYRMAVEGHSLGGALALHLGAKYQIPTIVQNTFVKTSLVAKSILQEMPFKCLRSRFVYWAVKKILIKTGWEIDTGKAALSLGEKLLVIQASHTDRVIPFSASLIKFFSENPNNATTVSLPDDLEPDIAHNVTAAPYRATFAADGIYSLFLNQFGFLKF